MTSNGSAGTAPEPQRPPQHTGRVLCILSGPGFRSAQREPDARPSPAPGQGWIVMRHRWTVKV